MIGILVNGAGGKMGREVVKAVLQDPDLTLVAAVDPSKEGADVGEIAGVGTIGLPMLGSLEEGLQITEVSIVVDFTNPSVIYEQATKTLEAKKHIVIGTTGLTVEQRNTLHILSKNQGVNVLVAPNFSLGAVMMMKVSAELAPYFPNVEIIELHHNHKYDAPSGTSILTAKLIADARERAQIVPDEDLTRESLAGARGTKVEDITIHSVRLPGYVAHQEVLFGGFEETLSIRHDSLSRESFMPGVILACKKIGEHPGLTYGLEHYL